MSDSHEPSPGSSDSILRPKRLGFLAVTATIAILGLAWLWLIADVPRGWKMPISAATAAGVWLAAIFWLLALSGLSRRAVAIGTAVLILPPAVFFGLFRLELDGDLAPVRIAWRWAPKPHEALAQRAEPVAEEAASISVHDRDFPQFLGPDRNGVVQGVRLARDWTARPPRELWRREIGAGWSSFAVVGDHAFTQEQRGDAELVACYELATGRLMWRHEDGAYFASSMGGDGPRATPTVVDGRVYSQGAKGIVNCLDARTGDVVWQYDVIGRHQAKLTVWGKSCSPLVVDDLVIVTGGGERGPSLLALEKASGELRWSAAWDDREGAIADSYASPVLTTIDGQRQLLNVEDHGVVGYDLAGKALWRFPWPWSSGAPAGHPLVSQPIPVGGDRVFASAGYTSGSCLFAVERDGDRLTTRPLWQKNQMRTKFCNVAIRGDYAYGLDDRILSCIDWRTGERKWKGGRYGHGQILMVDDLILVQAENGEVVLVEAQPQRHVELRRLAALSDRTWNTLAFAAPYLLVRNDREAACFELPLADEPAGQHALDADEPADDAD